MADEQLQQFDKLEFTNRKTSLKIQANTSKPEPKL